jgi:hypothetical protein
MNYVAGIFDIDLANDTEATNQGKRATAAALARCKQRFGAFLEGGDALEVAARFDLIDMDLKQVVADVVAEYGGNLDTIEASVTSVLAAGGFCDDCHKWKSGPKAGCTCGDKSETTEHEDAPDEDDESASGDGGSTFSSVQSHWRVVGEALETEKLPDRPFGAEPWSNGPSPKMDKKQWKPNALNDEGNLKVIDTEGKGSPHPTEHHDISRSTDHSRDFKEQTRGGSGVTETETLKGTDSVDGAGFNTDKNQTQYPTRTFGDKGQQDKAWSDEAFPKDSSRKESVQPRCPQCGSGMANLDRMGNQSEDYCPSCGFADREPPTQPLAQGERAPWMAPGASNNRVEEGMMMGLASVDPDKNPIRESLRAEHNVLPELELQAAISAFKS